MEKLNYSFQVDSDIVNYVYNNHDNYLIESTDSNLNEKICAIYFSSNNLYFPNSEEVFCEEIVRKNKFEWYKCRYESASKHIFIRDVKKQWYLEGINSKINNYEMLLEFLTQETNGYRIVMIGSSAGGFASVLLGQLLKAEKILSFNGQFLVSDLLDTSNEITNPIVFRNRNNKSISKYFSVIDYINNPLSIFYFYSKNSPWDKFNREHVEELDINVVAFFTSHHGIPFVKSCLPRVINMPNEGLLLLSKKLHNPLIFSYRIEGVGFLKTLIKQVYSSVKRKIHK